MQPEHLTYQWLVPQLIAGIGGLLVLIMAIIAWVVNVNLHAIKNEIKENMVEVKNFMKSSVEKDHGLDIRITRLEDNVFSQK